MAGLNDEKLEIDWQRIKLETQFTDFHIEELQIVNIIKITNLQALPPVCGIYKVIDADGSVLYIGQAKNIYKRWKIGHHKISEILSKCGTNAYIEWVEVPEWLLNRAENSAISFYKPNLNKKNSSIV